MIILLTGGIQTGRKYTLFGSLSSQLGLCTLTAREILSQYCNNSNYNYQLELSFLEVKNNTIYDLNNMRSRVEIIETKENVIQYRGVQYKTITTFPFLNQSLMYIVLLLVE